ncbi:MAG: lipoprotein-releasing ABC transporter permease subunit [Pseudomonadales bacterium]|nr:lipoprotein-releasing ABC transporter permease subunit [Pseudomonadales bacterium]
MYKPMWLFIGLRYTRTRKKTRLLSFVSLVSTLGVSLGVMALILVLSVINGSTAIMREETLKTVPHASITPADGAQWPQLLEQLQVNDNIRQIAPYLEAEAWVRVQGASEFAQIRGVDPEAELLARTRSGATAPGSIQALSAGGSGIVLGTSLAARLGVYTGDTLSLTPLSSLLQNDLASARNFQVLGVSDLGFYASHNTALVHLDDAQALFGEAFPVRLRVWVDDVFAAGQISRAALSEVSPAAHEVVDWQQSQASLFGALRMEKIMTGFMLLMIVLIGAVNIVSTLVMVVADKSADIAILRTMGASSRVVMSVFMTQGLAVGVLGTLFGAGLGIVLTTQLQNLTRAFENLINSTLFGNNVYMISHLQAELLWSDVLLVCLSAVLISFLATLYPAFRASRIHPAEVLRYE